MSQTNRKYVAKMKRSKINMAEAVQELSANAYKLLGLIYYNVIDLDNLDNDTVMKLLGVSRRPFFSAKDELKDKGYIQIHQIGSTKFVWVLGKEAVKKDNDLYAPKIQHEKESFAKKY